MEYGCYVCNKIIKTGEKFTFTKEGPVHMDCFVAAERKKVPEGKAEYLRNLSMILDYELTMLVSLLSLKSEDKETSELIRRRINAIEKQAGETTGLIYNL
ncbi:MAG: DUF2175 family protein [Ferroplasma sp.]|uniref:DUF2175 family protein n=1 Tax=Ferroplasma sp. TaxID=2591003 RepID=UPI00281627D3|nr:DUF2175 family protein [Ferroplasma sp.]WMT52007.1 MAG: DUF2175 family protein [Ferroplasma sp.]